MRSGLVAIGIAVVIAGSSLPAVLTARAADESELRIEYDPPHVSVAAREVGLGELLMRIGTKVGFTVADGAVAPRRVTVSIAGASVDDLLRQLLRDENHAILYRPGADAVAMVDRIVLLGTPTETVPDGRPRSGQEAGTSPQMPEAQASAGDVRQPAALAGVRPPPAAVAEPDSPPSPPGLGERPATTSPPAPPAADPDHAARSLKRPAAASTTPR